MQNQGYLQQLKEQLKVKSLELKKYKKASELTTQRQKQLILKYKNEIDELKADMKKKDGKIQFLRKNLPPNNSKSNQD
jgi:hypothetical protein